MIIGLAIVACIGFAILVLDDTQITDAAVAELKKTLPKCRIYYLKPT